MGMYWPNMRKMSAAGFTLLEIILIIEYINYFNEIIVNNDHLLYIYIYIYIKIYIYIYISYNLDSFIVGLQVIPKGKRKTYIAAVQVYQDTANEILKFYNGERFTQ